MTRPDLPVVARPTADDHGESCWSLLGVPKVVEAVTGDMGSVIMAPERGWDWKRRELASVGLEGVSCAGGMVCISPVPSIPL